MNEHDKTGRLQDMRRRSFMKAAAAAGLSLPATIGLSSVAGLRAFAQGTATGTLTFGNAEPPTSNYWDPAAGFGLVDEQVASLVHDTLVAFDEKGALTPCLATEWTFVNPQLVTLTLRSDATFHDGTPVTAEDVKASIDRLGDGALPQSMVATPGINVTIVSPTEIEVNSPQAFGVVMSALAFIKVLPKANIANPDNFANGALGSGPYRFVSYNGTDVTLEANPDYWGGAPNIATVIFRYIEDAQARINALLSGQVDILTRVSSEDIARIEGNDAFYTTTVSPPAQIVGIYQHNGPLGDLKVRQAVAHAIDREGIAASLMRGLNPVAQSSIPTNAPYYEELETRFEYDPEKARALLAESGYPDGVTLRMSTSTLVPNQIEIDQVIAASLQQVGITVEVERLEVGAFRSSYNTYDISLNTLASFNNDPDFILGFYTGGTAEAVFHYSDAEYEALHAAQRAAGPDERQQAVTAAARYLWENQVTLYLSDEVWYSIVSKRVEGYARAPLVGEPLVSDARIVG
ncbi:ABC transporter substrate-binding protein [Oceanibium sediminis]|uniref:ABC transporter substrate-binding protein n=1 Tax=Oceanibium sediminis TaxID=2026339 RepID=UPI000DD428D6|nr:ABC transporter substrate-binding protein [Oceanibium sediminis]